MKYYRIFVEPAWNFTYQASFKNNPPPGIANVASARGKVIYWSHVAPGESAF